MPDIEIEKEIIELFFQKNKRKRFIGFVANPRNRKKWIIDLYDARYLMPELSKEITGANKNTRYLRKLLMELGINDEVYVACSNEQHDGKFMTLEEALDLQYLGMQIYAYSQNAKTGFFLDENDNIYIFSMKFAK